MTKTRKPTKLERDAIHAVLDSLENYLGEEIVKDEHPLHIAIQRLEKLCRPLGTRGCTKQAKLFEPACQYWFRCVWASRPYQATYELSGIGNELLVRGPNKIITKDRHPAIAKEWARKLERELVEWLVEFPIFEKKEPARCTWYPNTQW